VISFTGVSGAELHSAGAPGGGNARRALGRILKNTL
jgi:hypothetical protein